MREAPCMSCPTWSKIDFSNNYDVHPEKLEILPKVPVHRVPIGSSISMVEIPTILTEPLNPAQTSKTKIAGGVNVPI